MRERVLVDAELEDGEVGKTVLVRVSGDAAAAFAPLLAALNVDAAGRAVLEAGLAGHAARLGTGASLTLSSVTPQAGMAVSGMAADAVVVDGRALAGGSVQLDGVGYAGILGAVQLIGGGGGEAVAGDGEAQGMTLGGGDDTALGGGGADTINGNMGADLLNGNQGADVMYGGKDDDVVLGGKDDDHVNGNLGDDVVNGNAGADTVFGGQGNDTVNGGKDDDRVFGDLGDDWVSGDLGNDTLTGGAGADLFVFAIGGGFDTATDFNAAEGDRLVLMGGMGYSVGENGAGNAVITLTSGDALTLDGVKAGQVSADWVVIG